MLKHGEQSYTVKDSKKKISDVGKYVDIFAVMDDFFKISDKAEKEHEKNYPRTKKLLG